jgi:hypothetical protein
MRYLIAMPISPKVCEKCGREWMPKTRYQMVRNRFCSMTCSLAVRVYRHKKAPLESECPMCGKRFHRNPSRLRRQQKAYCSGRCRSLTYVERCRRIASTGRSGWTEESLATYREKMSGERNPAWRGGVTMFKKKGNYKGIPYVRAPEWARPMARKDGYIMEHRLVMARMCGRLLDRTEVVHHRNHDPTDNRPENLELWPSNQMHKLAEHGRPVTGAANRVSLPA